MSCQVRHDIFGLKQIVVFNKKAEIEVLICERDMSLPPLYIHNEFIEIPQKFHSDLTGKPFDKCMMCEKDLLENGVQYRIEKAIKKYPDSNAFSTIFEYAICMDCGMQANAALSAESKQKIEAYFEQHVDLQERRAQLLEEKGMNTDDWISHCAIKGTPLAHAEEYQIYAHCEGGDMLFSYWPMAISSEAIDEIADLLSEKTLDEIDRFTDQINDLPPELKDLFKDKPLVVI